MKSFVEENSKFILKNTRFKNNKLVIDGCNLYYLLYFDEGLDQVHGGEYDDFENLLIKLVTALRHCGIEPYVVLDGGSDYSNKKFETLQQRGQDKIQKAYSGSQGIEKGTLPTLIKSVTKQVLSSLKVPFAQCYGEADLEIAALARDWRCPVLSGDSDFYIFENPAGFLPLNHFKWKTWKNGFIRCKRYSTAAFCSFFQLQRPLLPLFAALAGNDYVKLRTLGVEPNWARYVEGGGRFSRLEGMLSWLSGFHRMEDALRALMGLLEDCDSRKLAEVQLGLGLGMEDYRPPPSTLKVYFTEGVAPPLPPGAESLVPAWAQLPLTQGRLASICLDILLHRMVVLSSQVQDMSQASSNATSQPIRQVAYGLLQHSARGKRRDLSVCDRPFKGPVTEYDRTRLDLTSTTVQPVVRGAATQLQLDSLDQAPQLIRLTVYLETLGVSQSVLSGIAPHLHVPVCATSYWLCRAQPAPCWPLLQALLLGLVYGEQRRQGLSLGQTSGVPSMLQQLRMIQHQCRERHLNLEVAHACSQWQSCFKDSATLNQLLCCPLVEPVYACVFKGTLVHQLTAALKLGATAESLLAGDAYAEHLYSTLLGAVLKSQPKNKPSVLAQSGAKPPATMDKLTARLERLALAMEEDSKTKSKKAKDIMDDLPDCNALFIRTRYKTKNRKSQTRYPELARKQERKGWD